jgi:hypothetical protein
MKNKILLLFVLMLNGLAFGQNIVVNGDFSNGLNSWSTFLADWEGVNANYSANNNEANVTGIVNAGGATWWVQLNQELSSGQISSLVVGQTYQITFQARTNSASRPLRLFFGENGGGFAALTTQDYTINNTMQTYSSTFVVGATYGAMKLGFEMGTSNDEVYIDNVVLQVSSAPAPPAQPAGFVANTPSETSIFVACGPNQVGSNVVYKLFYSPTASAPSNPLNATEYVFGSTAGDGGGNNAFGFNVSGLQAATAYTLWLYQYNSTTMLYSEPAIATETTLGGGGGNAVITFRLDMSEFTEPFTLPQVKGTFNNWCLDCAPMNDMGNGIWELAIELAPGNYEYKFSSDGWDIEEELTPGSPCTFTTGEFTNRTLTVGTENVTLPTVCWNSCVACGASTTRAVTFQVDMSDYTGTFTTPEVNGTFNNWCGNCAPMTNSSGDIWEITISLEDGTYEYKFSHDNWVGQEALTPGLSCTVTEGEFTNRTLVVTENVTLPVVCWNACVSCDLVSLESNELSGLNVYPNPSNGVINIQGSTDATQVEYVITDAQGRVVSSGFVASNTLNEQVDLSQVGAGVYFVRLSTQNAQRVERVVIVQ